MDIGEAVMAQHGEQILIINAAGEDDVFVSGPLFVAPAR
jgi:hypothetical protein